MSISIVAVTTECIPTHHHLDVINVSSCNWHRLGLQLKVEHHTLDKIEQNYYDNVHRCRIEMFSEWIKSVDNPTYKKLIEALVVIGEKMLAQETCTTRGE